MSVVEVMHSHALSRPSSNIFARIVEGVSAWNNARVTRDALSRLSDRELNDIGLSRSDIDRVARGL